jgi:hypothetical protein
LLRSIVSKLLLVFALGGLAVAQINLGPTNPQVKGVLQSANGGLGWSDTTFTGNSHKLVTSTGSQTNTHCVQIDSNGNHVDAGDKCALVASLQNQSYTYNTDSGTTNAYAVTLSPAPSSYAAGLIVVFKATNANTGASTLNVNSLGTKTILKNGIAALTSGDIVSGEIVVAVYDGTNFQMTSSVPAPAGGVSSVSGSSPIASSGGSTPTISLNSGGVNSTYLATANKTRTCHIPYGSDDAASDLTTAQIQPQHGLCFIDVAATILQVTVKAAGGTPNIIVSKNHAGSQTALLSGALATGSSGAVACSNTGGTTGIDGSTTCSATLQNTTVAAGDYIDATGGATSTGAKWFTVDVTFTVN